MDKMPGASDSSRTTARVVTRDSESQSSAPSTSALPTTSISFTSSTPFHGMAQSRGYEAVWQTLTAGADADTMSEWMKQFGTLTSESSAGHDHFPTPDEAVSEYRLESKKFVPPAHLFSGVPKPITLSASSQQFKVVVPLSASVAQQPPVIQGDQKVDSTTPTGSSQTARIFVLPDVLLDLIASFAATPRDLPHMALASKKFHDLLVRPDRSAQSRQTLERASPSPSQPGQSALYVAKAQYFELARLSIVKDPSTALKNLKALYLRLEQSGCDQALFEQEFAAVMKLPIRTWEGYNSRALGTLLLPLWRAGRAHLDTGLMSAHFATMIANSTSDSVIGDHNAIEALYESNVVPTSRAFFDDMMRAVLKNQNHVDVATMHIVFHFGRTIASPSLVQDYRNTILSSQLSVTYKKSHLEGLYQCCRQCLTPSDIILECQAIIATEFLSPAGKHAALLSLLATSHARPTGLIIPRIASLLTLPAAEFSDAAKVILIRNLLNTDPGIDHGSRQHAILGLSAANVSDMDRVSLLEALEKASQANLVSRKSKESKSS